MSDPTHRYHVYNAEATILEGHLDLPFAQKIGSHTYSKLNEQGGYVTQHSENIRLGGAISFRSAHTHVAGNRDGKVDHGWNTLTTSVIEGLNVMEVLTADRIIAQISTDHPPEGYVPRITFLGTRFENLRIIGEPVKVDLDWNILGPKPADDAPYTTHPDVLDRVTRQYKRIHAAENLPGDIRERYNQLPSSSANRESIECSLVNQVEGSFPGRAYGHVIDIPDFGKIYLATLRVHHEKFDQGVPKITTISLTMLELKMGCIASGNISLGSGKTNGQSIP